MYLILVVSYESMTDRLIEHWSILFKTTKIDWKKMHSKKGF